MFNKNPSVLKILTAFDVLLIAVILLAGTSGIFLVKAAGHEGKTVEIFISSRLAGIYPLAEERIIEIDGKTGKIFIEIADKMVWIEETTCPHKVCQRMGKKKNANDLIICVPNEMIIKIPGKRKELIEAITQ